MAGLKLTEEHRQALLGLMPFTQNGTIEYTPKAFEKLDIPKNKKSIYIMRAYNKDEMTRVRKLINDVNASKGSKDDQEEEIRDLTRRSIVGWKNIYDLATGDEIEFKKDSDGSADKGLFEDIPDVIKAEIYTYSLTISGLMKKEIEGLGY